MIFFCVSSIDLAFYFHNVLPHLIVWGAMCIKTKTLDSIYICRYVFTYCACVFTYVAMYLYIMLVYLYIPLCIYIPRLCISIVDMYLYSVLCIYIYGCVSIGTGYIILHTK